MIREPAVAGQFYSANEKTLSGSIRSYIQTTDRTWDGKAIVVPHAGYMYSGAVAGTVYGSVRLPKRFIILGPNHTGVGVPLSLYPEGEWRTPLGLATIDTEINQRLKQECLNLREDRTSHVREHSLEVQIPFLQVQVPEFSFAAICVGIGNFSALQDLGRAVARVVASMGEPVLLVASSDMNHYESAAVAAEKDRYAIDQVLEVNPAGLYRVVDEKDISMCGYAPTVAVLTACRELGASRGHLLRYANSGDVNGDYNRVVGYAGMVIV